MAEASEPRWEIEVPFDEQVFLLVPLDVRIDHSALADWIDDVIGRHHIQDSWGGPSEELSQRLEGQVRLLSTEALAAFLLCPRGLPGDALVEVFVADSSASHLDDIPLGQEAALPQRIHDISSDSLGQGRAVATLVALDDGATLGQIRHQFLHEGVFVDVTAASTDLGVLGACVDDLEALSTGVVVRPVGAVQ